MTLHTAAEAAIDAPASTVLAILRDFDGRHRRILPAAFSNLVIEEGGIGAGTVMRFDLTLGGRTSTARARVEEPEPGVIVERLVGRDMVTRFTVRTDGAGARTRIETRWQPAHGIAGMLEQVFAPRMLRRLYEEELSNLNDVARTVSSDDEMDTVAR